MRQMHSSEVEEEVLLESEGIVVAVLGGMTHVGCSWLRQALGIPTMVALREDQSEGMMGWTFAVMFGLPRCTSFVVQPDCYENEGMVDLVEVWRAPAFEGDCAFDQKLSVKVDWSSDMVQVLEVGEGLQVVCESKRVMSPIVEVEDRLSFEC